MVYEDDGMCANCGGIRVAKSTLCADCLATFSLSAGRAAGELRKQIEIESANAAVIISEKNEEIKVLEYQLKLQRRLLQHIFREYQELQKLRAVDIVA